MYKDFLYLVQARSDMIDSALSLENERADLLIHTFDQKINHPKEIFKAGTYWGSGRNLLVDKARKLKHKYKYYVLLDDDIHFPNKSFRDFEDEILKIDPDICIPVVTWTYASPAIHRYFKYIPFRYLAINVIDSACICFCQELFFSTKILPYHTDYANMPIHKLSYYPSRYFWIMLFEHYGDRKLLVAKNIICENKRHDVGIGQHYQHSRLVTKIRKSDSSFKHQISKHLPFLMYILKSEIINRKYHQLSKVSKILWPSLLRNPRRYLLNYIIPLLPLLIKYKLSNILVYRKAYMVFFILPIFIWRDIKLNLKLSKKQ